MAKTEITTYTKEDLINKVAATTGTPKTQAEATINATLEAIKNMMIEGSTKKDGAKLALHNFGVFETSRTKAKNGRNPSTGEAIKIPASRKTKFAASKVWKLAVAAIK